MSVHKHDKVDYKGLARYLAGESTPEEAIEVDNWILYSEENRKLFDRLAAGWLDIRNMPMPASPRTLPGVMFFRVGIAASFLVVVGAFWLFFRSRDVSGATAASGLSSITKKAGKEMLRDTLPDGSLVVQNANSTLHYADSFNRDNRDLQLTGDASFDVTRNPAKPFLLRIGKLRVMVLGTSFHVRQNDSTIEVSVETGAVRMFTDSDSLIVKAGGKGLYDIKENKFLTAAASRVLIFENRPLRDIVTQIEKAYGVTVIFSDAKLKDLTMSSSFDNDSLAYVFEVISVTLHLNYKIENNVVYISGSDEHSRLRERPVRSAHPS
jgi:transmembrane sensor